VVQAPVLEQVQEPVPVPVAVLLVGPQMVWSREPVLAGSAPEPVLE
jgi:hypothetical protein